MNEKAQMKANLKRLTITYEPEDGPPHTLVLGDGETLSVTADITGTAGLREVPSEDGWAHYEHDGMVSISLQASGPKARP